LYLDRVAEDLNIEATGLLDGLEGIERAERAELVTWLLGEGVTVEKIRSAVSPMLIDDAESRRRRRRLRLQS
jgi:adenylate cyclase